MSSVIVAKASVILAFRFVISGTGVENTLSLTYPHKKKSKWGWYPAIVVARVSDHLSQSTCLEMLHPKTDEHVNRSMELHHLVRILSMAETLLRCNVKSVMFVIRKIPYAHPGRSTKCSLSVWFFDHNCTCLSHLSMHILSISPHLLYFCPHHYKIRVVSIFLSLSLHCTVRQWDDEYTRDTNKMRHFIPEWLSMLGTPPESLTRYPALFPDQTGTVMLCWSL